MSDMHEFRINDMCFIGMPFSRLQKNMMQRKLDLNVLIAPK